MSFSGLDKIARIRLVGDLAPCVFGVVAAIVLAGAGEPWWAMLIPGLLFLVGVGAFAGDLRMRRAVRSDDREVRIYNGLRAITIRWDELSGVGLLFRWMAGRPATVAGWYLTLWDAKGRRHVVLTCYVDSHWAAADYVRGSGPTETADDLAASVPGGIAQQIHDRALRVQGLTGPLATRHEERMFQVTPWTRDPDTYASWAPGHGIVYLTRGGTAGVGDEPVGGA